MAASPIVQKITSLAQQHGLDPKALLAVASQEGLSGRIGDNGHAFGPFQLNDSGGVITGKFQGQTPDRIQAWAQSDPGLNYAIDGIQKVAAGLHGQQAVNAIVSRFERPANPQREIQGALAAYGQTPAAPSPAGAAAAAPTAPPAVGAAPTGMPAIVASLLQNARQTAGLAPSPLPLLMQRTETAAPTSAATPRVAPSNGAAAPLRTLASAAGGLTAVPARFDTRPGIQVDAAILPTVTRLAQRFGVRVNSGYRSPQHNAQVGGAENSDHLRGDAVDFTGPPQALQALYRYVQGRFPYVEPMAQARDHVHVSFRRGS